LLCGLPVGLLLGARCGFPVHCLSVCGSPVGPAAIPRLIQSLPPAALGGAALAVLTKLEEDEISNIPIKKDATTSIDTDVNPFNRL
jgi:hypothetical protein